MNCTYQELSKIIDHELLVPTLDTRSIEEGVRLALAYDVASVCIVPWALEWCVGQLEGSAVKVSTTVGFPHGSTTTSMKLFESIQAIDAGAQELEMVVNIGLVLSEKWDSVQEEVAAVALLVHETGQKVKVNFENSYLGENHILRLCDICTAFNVDWVSNSTDFAKSVFNIKELKLMRSHLGPNVQVKASGGIRNLDTVLAAKAHGATRIGTSATFEILDEARKRLGMSALSVAGAEIF